MNIWRCCRRRKFLHSCGRFLCGKREGKKPQKLLMIPGGSFGGSAVGVSPSCESRLLLHLPSPSLPPPTYCTYNNGRSTNRFQHSYSLAFSLLSFLERKLQKHGRSSMFEEFKVFLLWDVVQPQNSCFDAKECKDLFSKICIH